MRTLEAAQFEVAQERRSLMANLEIDVVGDERAQFRCRFIGLVDFPRGAAQ